MDRDYPVDLRAVFELIDSTEVITFPFVTVPQRLLIDARHNEMEGPLPTLVPREMERKEHVRIYNPISGAGYHGLWERTC